MLLPDIKIIKVSTQWKKKIFYTGNFFMHFPFSKKRLKYVKAFFSTSFPPWPSPTPAASQVSELKGIPSQPAQENLCVPLAPFLANSAWACLLLYQSSTVQPDSHCILGFLISSNINNIRLQKHKNAAIKNRTLWRQNNRIKSNLVPTCGFNMKKKKLFCLFFLRRGFQTRL